MNRGTSFGPATGARQTAVSQRSALNRKHSRDAQGTMSGWKDSAVKIARLSSEARSEAVAAAMTARTNRASSLNIPAYPVPTAASADVSAMDVDSVAAPSLASNIAAPERPPEHVRLEEEMKVRFKATVGTPAELTAPKNYDVIIVGGGLAGLGAADAIETANTVMPQPVTWCIMEAHDYPGGRAGITVYPEKGYLDMGGQYIGGTQNYLQFQIAKYTLPTVPTYLNEQKNFYYELGSDPADPTRAGQVLAVPGDNPFAFPGGASSAVRLLMLFNELAMKVRATLDDPWDTPIAREYDKKTVAQVMDEFLADPWFHQPKITDSMRLETRGAMVLAIRSAFSEEPENMSAFFFLLYAAAAGGTSQLFDVTGGPGSAEATRFTYGVTSLLDAMVEKLDKKNERIFCGRVVTQIAYQPDGSVKVSSTKLGSTDPPIECTAQHVIIAMSPGIAKKIVFNPPLRQIDPVLGPMRENLMDKSKMGATIKAFLSYKTPFWRSKNLMGKIFSMYEESIAEWSLDNGWEPDSNNWHLEVSAPKFPYPLMIFITGDKARESLRRDTVASRKERILKQLTKIFGEQARSELVSEVDNYCEFDYALDPFADGCPTSIFGPGVLTASGPALRKPIKSIHWAGTESATEWIGYMNGALQSGYRAAHECISAMAPST